jgi:hypothetical protein
MELNHDDRMLLMLYGESTLPATVQTLEELQNGLGSDDADLNQMLASLLLKLQHMSDAQFNAIVLQA